MNMVHVDLVDDRERFMRTECMSCIFPFSFSLPLYEVGAKLKS
jgi:hypothetical protein